MSRKKTKKDLIVEDISSFVSRTKKLLAIEKNDDVNLRREESEHFSHKELQNKGVCLRKIEATNVSLGLYGRTIVQFFVNFEHKFTVGMFFCFFVFLFF